MLNIGSDNIIKEKFIDKRNQKLLGYTRCKKGKVISRHEIKVANTITTSTGGAGNTDQFVKQHENRYRRLTPTECFRLMDFSESFMDNIKKHNELNPKKQISDSQLYKQAGNSIVRKKFIILIEKLNLQ